MNNYPDKSNAKKYIEYFIALAIVIVAVIVSLNLLFKPVGTLSLKISPTDATVVVDDKQLPTASAEIKLSPGKHLVLVSKPGYITQHKPINIKKNQTLKFKLDLPKDNPGNVAVDLIKNTVYKDYPNHKFKLLDTKTLYDGDWVIAKLAGEEDTVTVILKKDNTTAGYSIFLAGPPFSPNSLDRLPSDVYNSVNRQGLKP